MTKKQQKPSNPVIDTLLAQGVRIPHPESVYVAPEIRPERIAAGVTLHPGCRLLGAETSVGPDSSLGEETPATINDCRLGRGVRFAGGFAAGATFMDRVTLGSAAHIRPGTILEEEASAGHAVGLKQTILLPFVTLGSLVNFCDCLMAGGASRKNHSEVGSSYVHFNYTPNRDKATPSLFGDVPRGVMLDQPPIFLGGQGGTVGPIRVEFGTLVPAGTILRKDTPAKTQPATASPGPINNYRAGYKAIDRVIRNNLAYIGNLRALQAWYRHVRKPCLSGDTFRTALWQGAMAQLESAILERLSRLKELAGKLSEELCDEQPATSLPESIRTQHRQLVREWPGMEEALADTARFEGEPMRRDKFLSALPAGGDYLAVIRGLPHSDRAEGTAWLQGIVTAAIALWKTND